MERPPASEDGRPILAASWRVCVQKIIRRYSVKGFLRSASALKTSTFGMS